jgi:hypothetical protein
MNITLNNQNVVEKIKAFLSKQKGVEDILIWEETNIPNKSTIAAMKELRDGKGTKCNSLEELYSQLGM